MRWGVAAIPHAPSARDMPAPRSAQRRHSNRLTPTGLTKVDSVTARAHGLPSAEVMATSLDVEIETVRPSLELLHLAPRRPRDRERWLRRRLNTAVAAVALVVASPLLLLIAVLIKLTSRGPVLFRQTRIGLDRRALSRAGGNTRRRLDQGGHPFTMYKFRTMRLAVQRDPQIWAQPDDARVTPIGRVLRKFRLDELPQLFNVLRGDMNIVGPRPEQPAIFVYLREQIEGYQRRQRVRPGITGWAQVNQGYDQSVEDVRRKVAYDLEYIRRQSALEDLRIMLRTIPVMVFRRGGW
jgi:lipopolysaccharide/colanic/teichoic acid biosynthesis glycosyltransferase